MNYSRPPLKLILGQGFISLDVRLHYRIKWARILIARKILVRILIARSIPVRILIAVCKDPNRNKDPCEDPIRNKDPCKDRLWSFQGSFLKIGSSQGSLSQLGSLQGSLLRIGSSQGSLLQVRSLQGSLIPDKIPSRILIISQMVGILRTRQRMGEGRVPGGELSCTKGVQNIQGGRGVSLQVECLQGSFLQIWSSQGSLLQKRSSQGSLLQKRSSQGSLHGSSDIRSLHASRIQGSSQGSHHIGSSNMILACC